MRLLLNNIAFSRYPKLSRKDLLFLVTLIITTTWFAINIVNPCKRLIKFRYVKLDDSLNVDLSNPMVLTKTKDGEEVYNFYYNRYLPIIFVGGVPRSGTTLMRAMLDSHPSIRCGQETRISTKMMIYGSAAVYNENAVKKLLNSGFSEEELRKAAGSFLLELIVKHAYPAQRLCNKDPISMRNALFLSKVFPNSKVIFMIRDGRATAHSIMTRNLNSPMYNISNPRQVLKKWNEQIEIMYTQCKIIGPERCLPVHYEQLVLQPKKEMKRILSFLQLGWSDSVLHHDELIGKEVPLSKLELSSDQIIKPIHLEALYSWVGYFPEDVVKEMDTLAPMLNKVGYNPFENPPNYGEADARVKENTNKIIENKQYWVDLAKHHGLADIKYD